MKILYNTEAVKELAELQPVLTTPRGQLFQKPGIPFAGIRLSVSLQEYDEFLNTLPPAHQPNPAWIIPASATPSATEGNFSIIVDAPITAQDGQIFVDGQPVTLL